MEMNATARHINVNATSIPNGDGSYTVQFDELPITTEGDTLDKAYENADDALTEFIMALLEDGYIERVLNQYGVTIHQGESPMVEDSPPVSTDSGEIHLGWHHPVPAYG